MPGCNENIVNMYVFMEFPVFPGKALGPGFSLCCRPLALYRGSVERGRRISVGENSVVKMKVFFRSPPKKQAMYVVCASAPSKKRVKM